MCSEPRYQAHFCYMVFEEPSCCPRDGLSLERATLEGGGGGGGGAYQKEHYPLALPPMKIYKVFKSRLIVLTRLRKFGYKVLKEKVFYLLQKVYPL